jgi:hypothetical protein
MTSSLALAPVPILPPCLAHPRYLQCPSMSSCDALPVQATSPSPVVLSAGKRCSPVSLATHCGPRLSTVTLASQSCCRVCFSVVSQAWTGEGSPTRSGHPASNASPCSAAHAPSKLYSHSTMGLLLWTFFAECNWGLQMSAVCKWRCADSSHSILPPCYRPRVRALSAIRPASRAHNVWPQ